MSIIKNFNRKDRRKFNKLSKEEKDQIVQYDINEKVNEAISKEVPKVFSRGVLFANQFLYEKYLLPRSKASGKEKERITKELFAEIEKRAEIYRKGNSKEEKE